MTIAYTHPVADYITNLLPILRAAESGDKQQTLPYYDRGTKNSAGEYQSVTIGDGINIDWSNTLHLKLVLNRLGLIDSSAQIVAANRATAGQPPETLAERTLRLDGMVGLFQQTFRNNRPAENAKQSDVDKANLKLQTDLNNMSILFGGNTFQLDSGGTQSEAIIRQIINGGVNIPGFLDYPVSKGKQARLDAIIGNGLPHNSKEYLAVMSMFYNGEGTVPARKKLATAIRIGDRAGAWYEIRYGTNSAGWEEIDNNLVPNSKLGAGLAKRRYEEAQLFGLYGDSSQPGYDPLKEAKDVYRMFTHHRDRILRYEAMYGVNPDGTLGTRNMISGVDTIVQALDPAKMTILADLGANANPDITNAYQAWIALGNNPATFNSTKLSIATGQGAAVDARQYTALGALMGEEVASNDIVIAGEGGILGTNGYMLLGGMGDDLLIGGTGADVLYGGGGNDAMSGGVGDDTYILDGTGQVTIEDKEGNNRVLLNGRELGVFIRQTDGNYLTADGKIHGKFSGTDFIVSDDQNAQVTLNKDFTEGDFGITFQDAPVDGLPVVSHASPYFWMIDFTQGDMLNGERGGMAGNRLLRSKGEAANDVEERMVA